ncbi:MAG TPA: hypothetical protein VF104_01210, partial [Burkholderiales bacterium]
MKAIRYLAQALLYLPLMAIIGYFSTSPVYTNVPPDQALVRLSFSHAGQRRVECRQRSPEELAKLAPNMRAAQDCPRERVPVKVALELDGHEVFEAVVPPSGLKKDLASTVYRRFPVSAGRHKVVARLSDQASGEFNHSKEAVLEMKPG